MPANLAASLTPPFPTAAIPKTPTFLDVPTFVPTLLAVI